MIFEGTDQKVNCNIHGNTKAQGKENCWNCHQTLLNKPHRLPVAWDDKSNLTLNIASPSGLSVHFNFLCKSIRWPIHTGKIGHLPTCAGTQKSPCWELCFQATTVLLPLCLSRFFLHPSAHLPPPLSTLPWWDEYTALGFPGFLNKNYPTFCV